MFQNSRFMVSLVRRLLAIFAIILIALATLAQQNDSTIPTPEWIQANIDSLRSTLLTNKKVPDKYEHSILAALMYYPDLEETRITFKAKPITTTMAAFPRPLSLFRKRENRHYAIVINERKNRRKAPLIKNVPFDARVGVFGHELAHIADYQEQNTLQIIGMGIAYALSNRYKQKVEYKIDKTTINRGLGKGLLAFRQYVEEEEKTTERYRKFKEKIYMSSEEISQIIEGLNNLASEENNGD